MVKQQQYIYIFLLLLGLQLLNSRRVVAPSEDFYQLLGVQRTADDAQIRKAFKKLALQYHPDKNKDDPEKAQEQFQKISNAYDVLIDPQLRDIYNKEGDRGLNEYFQAQARKEGEKHKEQKKEKEARVHDTFLKNTQIIELRDNLHILSKREQPWIVLLFAPNDIICEQIAPAFIEFAEAVGQFVRVGVVDCKLEINVNICQKEFEVFEYPAIFGIPTDLAKEYIKFDREINYKNLKNFAINLMDSYILYLSENNYAEFYSQRPHLPKLISFKQKLSTSPILKSLSKQYLYKLQIAEVDVHMEEEFASKFGITPNEGQPPTLIMLTNPEEYQGIKYEGIWNMDQIISFLRPFVYNSTATVLPRIESYPFQLQKKDIIKSHCDINDPSLCFLMIISKENTNSQNFQELNSIRKYYQNDKNIKFFYLLTDDIQENCLIDNSQTSIEKIIVIRPNKLTYQQYQQESSQQSVEQFIEEILAGKKFTQKLKNPLAACLK